MADQEPVIVKINCPPCKASGTYRQSDWPTGVGVVCKGCLGNGFRASGTIFTERAVRADITTVHRIGVNLPRRPFVTYEEFLAGKMPTFD